VTAGGPIVVKIGGTALEDQRSAPAVWRAVAGLSRSHKGGVVLVHGGGKAVDKHLDRLGFTTERREGIRITPEDQVDEIAAVLAGRINKLLVGSINAAGARAVGLCLGDGRAVRTVKTTKYSFDPGRVGECVPGDRDNGNLLTVLLREGFLPVVSSIGLDDEGRFLNVNADDAAAGIARALGAASLVLLTDVPGILDGQKCVVAEATSTRIEGMIASGEVTGGMIPKVRAAMEAARSIGAPVVILSGNDPEALPAWASGAPIGTRVVPG
jgi:acetylglutamate kinase